MSEFTRLSNTGPGIKVQKYWQADLSPPEKTVISLVTCLQGNFGFKKIEEIIQIYEVTRKRLMSYFNFNQSEVIFG